MGETMISVIIPVYNAEKFIGRALDSLVNQTYKDFEVIVVDDESTDKSSSIFLEYCHKINMTIISQPHKGVGSARNGGMEIANRELIFFLDADDYLLPHALETLYAGWMESHAPITVGGVFRQSPDGKVYKSVPPTLLGGGMLGRNDIKYCINDYLKGNDIYLVSHCWGRLYEKKYLDDLEIRFNENMTVGEDGVFNIECLTYTDRVCVINEPLYCYQMHNNSSGIAAIMSPSLTYNLAFLEQSLRYFFIRNGGLSPEQERESDSFISRLIIQCTKYAKKGHIEMTSYSTLTRKDLMIDKIKKEKGGNLVGIYGADVVGKAIFDICTKAGIEVVGFFDYNPELAGKLVRGVPVYNTSKLPNIIYIISVLSIKDVVDKLKANDVNTWHAGGVLLEGIDTDQTNPDYSIDNKKYQIESCRIAHEAYLKNDYVFIRSLDVMITERCSLRCKDCSNLMQYFERPVDYDPARIGFSVDTLLQNVDEIMEARVLGGDAFMSPWWAAVAEHLARSPKVRRVVVYTNGAILPKGVTISNTAKEKLVFFITDYGKLSRNLDKLIGILRRNELRYKVTTPTEWLDCATIHEHNRTGEENDRLFRECIATSLLTMVDGKVFRCPYAASLYKLGIKPLPEDYVDVRATNRKDISGYLVSDRAMSACDYCTSRKLANKVEPAVQMKGTRRME
jgi:glycosyltransferase involved in cell wall biosynthesis